MVWSPGCLVAWLPGPWFPHRLVVWLVGWLVGCLGSRHGSSDSQGATQVSRALLRICSISRMESQDITQARFVYLQRVLFFEETGW